MTAGSDTLINGIKMDQQIIDMLDLPAETEAQKRLACQMQFIAEIDKIKHIMRMTLLTDGSRRENDAEHSWHLAAMVIILHEYAPQPVNMERVLKMVIIHDLVEIYAGDTFAYDTAGNQDKEAREQAAADRLFSQLPADQESELRSLWEEFDRMDTADSLFAASLDRLQPFVHNVLTNGHTWKIGKVYASQVFKRMDPIRRGFPAVWPWVEAKINESIQTGLILKD